MNLAYLFRLKQSLLQRIKDFMFRAGNRVDPVPTQHLACDVETVLIDLLPQQPFSPLAGSVSSEIKPTASASKSTRRTCKSHSGEGAGASGTTGGGTSSAGAGAGG
ncbi:hypothetical protein LepocDRAFT_00000190, partial [Leptothrix ochracea L12]